MGNEPGNNIMVKRTSARNSVAGERSFKEGRVKEIESVSKLPYEWRDDFALASYFSEESNNLVKDKVIAPLEQVCQDLGMKYLWAGETFPIHVTFISGNKQDEGGKMIHGTETTTKEYEAVKNDPALNGEIEKIKGLTFTFKDLLIVGDNIILTAREIPEAVTKFRKEAEKIEKNYGLIPRPRYEILHITIGRVHELPKEEKVREEFVRAFREIRRKIRNEPLILNTEGFFNGRNIMGIPEDN